MNGLSKLYYSQGIRGWFVKKCRTLYFPGLTYILGPTLLQLELSEEWKSSNHAKEAFVSSISCSPK